MFIDIHAHAYRHPFPQIPGRRPFPRPEELIPYYDRCGIECSALMPLIGPEYYLPQSNEDIFEMAERFPGRFIPFVNIHPQAVTNLPNAPLDIILEHYRQRGAKGVGEVICNRPILDPYLWNFFGCVQKSGLPMTIHLAHRSGAVYGMIDEPGLPGLAEVLASFPKLRILGHSQTFWAEISVLDTVFDRAGYPTGRVTEGAVPKLMRRFPNLYGDLSAGSGCNALTRDPEYAVEFLTEFQDRLLFGLDLCSDPGNAEMAPLAQFLIRLRDEGKISGEIFAKVARENAIRVLGL